jgi:hypothetical protein
MDQAGSGCWSGSCIIRGLTGADGQSGELRASAPRWVATAYLLLGLLVRQALPLSALGSRSAPAGGIFR